MSAAEALLESGHDLTVYEPGSIMGGRSVGSTRIFRLAHVDPDLVRLAQVTRQRFDQWSEHADCPMLIGGGCVFTGGDILERADAMAKAGADYELVSGDATRLRLPVVERPATSLVDVGGGVVNVDAVRAYLTSRVGGKIVKEAVNALGLTPNGAAQVTTASGTEIYDAVVLAAGVNTSHLAAQVDIFTPPLITHHVRFTFRIDGEGWPPWLDRPTEGIGTYQHQAGPGLWAIGGHLEPALTAWEVGREAACTASRIAVLEYVQKHLTIDPTIVDSLYCTTAPLGDGVEFRRNGPVLAIYGDNLMKFAPLLGSALAAAVVDGTTPSVAGLVAS